MILNSFQLQKWEIDPLSNTEYDVEDISWEREGVVFTLIPEGINKSKFNHRLQLIWDSSLIVAYHVTDETYRSDCWGLDFLNNGRFYIT